jgi:hypothetical protein
MSLYQDCLNKKSKLDTKLIHAHMHRGISHPPSPRPPDLKLKIGTLSQHFLGFFESLSFATLNKTENPSSPYPRALY